MAPHRQEPPVHDRLQHLLLGGVDQEQAAAQLGIPAGLAYLVVTGHAADGSHADNLTSTQHLVNPQAHNPDASEAVLAWMRRRVQDDVQMQAAARAANAGRR
jgi:hypothetical protein